MMPVAIAPVVCPKRKPVHPLHLAHCSCGHVCSATTEDSLDAALFAHVVAIHTTPDPETRA